MGNPASPCPCGAGAWGNPVSPPPCSSSLCSRQRDRGRLCRPRLVVWKGARSGALRWVLTYAIAFRRGGVEGRRPSARRLLPARGGRAVAIAPGRLAAAGGKRGCGEAKPPRTPLSFGGVGKPGFPTPPPAGGSGRAQPARASCRRAAQRHGAAPRAAPYMVFEKFIWYTGLAVGLKPSAMECEARLRGLYRIISSKTIFAWYATIVRAGIVPQKEIPL